VRRSWFVVHSALISSVRIGFRFRDSWPILLVVVVMLTSRWMRSKCSVLILKSTLTGTQLLQSLKVLRPLTLPEVEVVEVLVIGLWGCCPCTLPLAYVIRSKSGHVIATTTTTTVVDRTNSRATKKMKPFVLVVLLHGVDVLYLSVVVALPNILHMMCYSIRCQVKVCVGSNDLRPISSLPKAMKEWVSN
jgi:hypothetical protein